MTEAIKPAPSPALYQPMNCPMTPARNDPAIPSRMVVIKPMFSLPGWINLAMRPMTKPNTIVQMMPMFLPPEVGCEAN